MFQKSFIPRIDVLGVFRKFLSRLARQEGWSSECSEQSVMLAVYMLLGLTLTLLQVGSYRQTSRWLWLIHCPLAPAGIFAALALAALAQLSVAVLSPLLIFVVATDLMTTHVVDRPTTSPYFTLWYSRLWRG